MAKAFPDACKEQIRKLNANIEMAKQKLMVYLKGVKDGMGLEGDWEADLELEQFKKPKAAESDEASDKK